MGNSYEGYRLTGKTGTRMETEFELTHHARSRLRQRAIPSEILDLLIEEGDVRFDRHGVEILYFGPTARKRVEHRIGRFFADRLGKYWSVSAVINGTRILTAEYRYKRLPRK